MTNPRVHPRARGGNEHRREVVILVLPWCINTGKSLIPLTLRFLAQKRNLLIPLELSRVMHQGIEEAGNQLLTFYEFPRAMWKSIRTTNALENLNREFRRRTKTQASFSSEESAVALLFGLIASGQIQLRRIDGYQRLSEVLEHAEAAA